MPRLNLPQHDLSTNCTSDCSRACNPTINRSRTVIGLSGVAAPDSNSPAHPPWRHTALSATQTTAQTPPPRSPIGRPFSQMSSCPASAEYPTELSHPCDFRTPRQPNKIITLMHRSKLPGSPLVEPRQYQPKAAAIVVSKVRIHASDSNRHEVCRFSVRRKGTPFAPSLFRVIARKNVTKRFRELRLCCNVLLPGRCYPLVEARTREQPIQYATNNALQRTTSPSADRRAQITNPPLNESNFPVEYRREDHNFDWLGSITWLCAA